MRTTVTGAFLRWVRWIALPLFGFTMVTSQVAHAQVAFRSAASASARAPAFRAADSSSSAIAFVAAGAQTVGTGASITPVIPAGTTANDFAVLIIAGRPTDLSQPAAPAGWTLRSTSLVGVGANDLKIMTFYKVLAGGDANPVVNLPANWQGAAAGMSGQIAVWQGVNTATPFDVADVTGTLTPANEFWTPTGITTVTNGALVLSAVATSDDNSVNFNGANGFTRLMGGGAYSTTTGGHQAVALGEKLQAAAGAVTMPTWDQVNNFPDFYAGIVFALRPKTTNLAILLPAGTIQNDVMIASVGVQPSTATITAPAGWTLVRRIDNNTATTNSLAVYYKVAGASEAASYSWTVSGSTYTVGGIQSFSDVDTATPIDVENGVATASSLTHATPTVTTNGANEMIVTSHTYAASRSWTAPAGMTESFEQLSGASAATGQSIEGARVLQAAAGATGTKTATAATTLARGNAHILALRLATPALTVNKPAGTIANDVMIASIAVQPSTTTITPPAGWTLVRRIDNAAATSNSLAIYSLAAGGAEPASYTWTLVGFTHAVGGIQSFSGVDTTTPIDVENGQTTVSGTSHATPSVTTTVSSTMLVTSHTYAASRTWTVPAGMTEAFDVASLTPTNTSGQSMEGNYVAQAAIGATGVKTATVGGSADVGNAHILALKPPPVVPTPGSFNAFETSIGANAVTGNIYTKLAGTAFSLDVVAITGGVKLTTFSANVTVELLANTTNAGLDAQNCPTAFTTIQGPTTAAIAAGRSTVNFSAVATAYRNVRVRVRYPTISPTVTNCSTDNFSIRPTGFSSVTSNMTNGASTGAPVAKAGDTFTMTAVAGVGYDGTPSIDSTLVTAHAGAVQVGAIGGSFSAAVSGTGTATGNAFTYSEVGNFTLGIDAVLDSGFTSVDTVGTDCTNDFSNSLVGGQYGCKFGNTVAAGPVGRFTPDHFDLGAVNSPAFGTACSGFSYIGQTFIYTTAPVITVIARNSAGLGNTTTRNYTGASWWKLSNATLTYPVGTSRGYAALTGTLDTSGLPATDPVVLDTGGGTSGTGTLTFGSGTGLLFTRTTPVAKFDAEIGLSINIIDADNVVYAANSAKFGAATAGNGIAFSTSKEQRFGRLRLQNANGSQLIALPIHMETQYWNGTGFITNTADNCTTIATSPSNNIGLGNYQTPLASGQTTASIPAGPFVLGIKTITLSAPGPGNNGAVRVVVNLGSTTTINLANTCVTWTGTVPTPAGANLSHLLGQWCGANYDRYPTARATFGVYKGADQFIYQRENY